MLVSEKFLCVFLYLCVCVCIFECVCGYVPIAIMLKCYVSVCMLVALVRLIFVSVFRGGTPL